MKCKNCEKEFEQGMINGMRSIKMIFDVVMELEELGADTQGILDEELDRIKEWDKKKKLRGDGE